MKRISAIAKDVKEFLKEEKGNGPEYGGIIVLGIITVVGLLTYLSTKVKGVGDETGDQLDKAKDYTYGS
ncbi:hypothetical protein N752_01180 [Desulforamulus aquiferis]|nr:hypothetical protein [Desulforamulus aquiferis]RYD07228.1 hypothetical protein N752_01180 [Desulforamulus aquiferis]